jgi:hypothetical protein
MKDKKLQLLILGMAMLIIAKAYANANSTKPLAEEITDGGSTPDKIGRALSKLTSGDVKVNETPEETKNAIG